MLILVVCFFVKMNGRHERTNGAGIDIHRFLEHTSGFKEYRLHLSHLNAIKIKTWNDCSRETHDWRRNGHTNGGFSLVVSFGSN